MTTPGHTAAITDDTPLAWNPRVASRSLEGTAFVLLQSRLLSLNDVGSRLWELFKEGATVRQAAEVVVEEYDTELSQAEPDVRRFAAVLVAKGLLIPMGAGHPPSGDP